MAQDAAISFPAFFDDLHSYIGSHTCQTLIFLQCLQCCLTLFLSCSLQKNNSYSMKREEVRNLLTEGQTIYCGAELSLPHALSETGHFFNIIKDEMVKYITVLPIIGVGV
ncbi:suppressor of cytokine signaling 6 [Platysternon megacephalum]|uniref:Suppressor of cytokine signaling 6 n=1 Tax=Platysternon megacephalum TaxID=55544 RepID=A0A4D9EKI9_9SAUR|nr:suppressor of cytokine signaling 6 [Platysternon megacephalum]